MHKLAILAAATALLLTGCRGEPTPRDYQNQPPAMTHSPKKASETPTAHGMPGPSPEPNKGKSADTPPPTLQNAPANDTTATTATVTTATHT